MLSVNEDYAPQKHSNNEPGYIQSIPVRNLWLLMFYASDLFQIFGVGLGGFEESPDDIPNLVARILIDAVEKRIRRQLSPAYRSQTAKLNRVRGRIDLIKTERHQLLQRGLVACIFEDLTVDTPRNCFVRGALESISKIKIQKDLAQSCRSLALTMKNGGVLGKPPALSQIDAELFGSHDLEDWYMLAAAKLAFEMLLPLENIGNSYLSHPSREIKWVRRLFERGVGGFYKVILGQHGWRVTCGEHHKWPAEEQTKGMHKILPIMKTDIILQNPIKKRKIIIDTKFNSILIKGQYRKRTLRSSYIFQIYSYIRSQVGAGDALSDKASGLLLHPAIGKMIDESIVIHGHRFRFATVDLSGNSQEIRKRLIEVIEE